MKHPNNIKWAWFFCFSICILLIVPVLIQDGMFMDAVQYSAISRNLSEGNGTFWNLQFDKYNIHELPAYSEQPPLAFGIVSIFFKIFGTGMYTERIYVFATLIITLFLLNYLWKIGIKEKKELQIHGWFPVLVWITIPIVFWGFRNNMLENTMGIFILLSCVFIIHAYKSKKLYFYLLLGSLNIFLATLTKGLPGLFSLSIPFCYYIAFKKKVTLKNVLFHTLFLMISCAGFYLTMFYIFPESAESFRRYFFDRALQRVKTGNETQSGLFIFWALFQQIAIPLCLGILNILFRKNKSIAIPFRKEIVFFFLIGLSGSLPLLFTPIQKQFYLIPAMPFFALSFSLVLLPFLNEKYIVWQFNKPVKNVLKSVTIICFITGCTMSILNIGKSSRNEIIIQDTNTLRLILPKNATISTTTTLYYDWVFHAYFIRNNNMYLDYKTESDFFLIDKRYDNPPTGDYVKIESSLKMLEIYKINK